MVEATQPSTVVSQQSSEGGKDKYKKKRNLGSGTYGEAILVQSQITHKLWVIKIVEMRQMTVEERQKARDEARILKVLNHPNITSFRDVFKDKHMRLNIVMEFCDGGELHDEICQRKISR